MLFHIRDMNHLLADFDTMIWNPVHSMQLTQKTGTVSSLAEKRDWP